MLANLRKTTKWVVGFVIFIFVALIVLEWGAQVSGVQRTPYAVKVNGEEISYDTIDGLYSRELNRLGYQSDTDQAELYKQVVDNVIEESLALQEAEKRGLVPTDDEIYAEVRNRFFRQQDGTIDEGRFEQARRQIGSAEWIQYEKMIRRDVTYWKIFNAVTAPITVTRAALEDYYDIRYQRALLRHVLVRPTRFVKKEAALAFYSAHPDSFFVAERVRGRHLLFPVPQGAPDDQRRAALGRAEAALFRISSGATTFDRLFTTALSDTSGAIFAEKLDWFERGQMAPDFDTAAFTQPVGVITNIIETPYGFHVAVFDRREPRRRMPFDEAELDIKASIVGAVEVDSAQKEATRLRDLIVSGTPFDDAARDHSDALSALRGGLLGYVVPGEMNPALYDDTFALRLIALEVGTRSGNSIVINPSISRELFRLEEGEISEVVGSTHGFHILRVENRLGGDPEDWDLVAGQLEREYRELLRTQTFRDWTQSLRKRADIEMSDHVKSRFH